MSSTVFLAVLAAALLHATWNAAVKGSSDKTLGMTSVIVGQMLPAGILLAFFPWPSAESLGWLALGLCFHLGYQLFLIAAYRAGDFSQVYPIARGTAPLVVTLISLFLLNVELTQFEILAILLIISGISCLAFSRQGDGLRNPKAASLALMTGFCIGGYSLADGFGARISPSAIGFMSALMFLNGIIFLAYVRLSAPGTLTQLLGENKLHAFGGGTASFAAYMIVVWAFTQAPIALVTALRETSIIFAMIIGIAVFGEKLRLSKIVAVLLAVAGLVLLRFGDMIL